jgi:hypothetical protein
MMTFVSAAITPDTAWRGLLICAVLLAGGVVPAAAQQFSADIVMTRDNVAMPAGRLRARDAKVRIETPDLPDAFFLVDASKLFAYLVRPATHIYMDARQSSPLTRLFVSVDPGEPCRQWHAIAQLAGLAGQADLRCERAGEEKFEGVSVTAFRVSSAEKQEFLAWIDRERRFPLRIKTADGAVVALEHIRDEAQPVSAFVLPPGLRKFSPETLVEHIKQSDVWVGEPNDNGSAPR